MKICLRLCFFLDVTEEILLRAQLDQETHCALHSVQKGRKKGKFHNLYNFNVKVLELHQQRLGNLRQQLDNVVREDWLYPSVKQLIGLQ